VIVLPLKPIRIDKAPSHLLADVRLAWRDIRTRFGNPRSRSSPAKQQTLGFNRDVTKEAKKSEGEKLREAEDYSNGIGISPMIEAGSCLIRAGLFIYVQQGS